MVIVDNVVSFGTYLDSRIEVDFRPENRFSQIISFDWKKTKCLM